jgi:hypothetical protein
MALLQLARAHGLAGDAAKARAAYENFLRLWKDADPDIPILRQATAEHTKLVSAPAAASQPTKKTSSEPHGSVVAANDRSEHSFPKTTRSSKRSGSKTGLLKAI